MIRAQTSSTFIIEGTLAIKALTTNFIPGSLEIILRGLMALRILNDLRAWILEASIPMAVTNKSIKEAITTKKSRIFQGFLRYGTIGPSLLKIKPEAMILILASIVNKTVNTISMYLRTTMKPESGSDKGLSITSVILEMMISARMKYSNFFYNEVSSSFSFAYFF
jgi:hypothetical protein